jgi:hypothetical protein
MKVATSHIFIGLPFLKIKNQDTFNIYVVRSEDEIFNPSSNEKSGVIY